MREKIAFLTLALCFVLVFLLTALTEDAQAQLKADELGFDMGKTKEGEVEDARGPTKLQMVIGLGSVLVAIVVVKWL